MVISLSIGVNAVVLCMRLLNYVRNGEISTDTAITMDTSCYIMPPKNSGMNARESSHWFIIQPGRRLCGTRISCHLR